MQITVHKSHQSEKQPNVSIILLDWSVRERFQALEWLPRQDVPREMYELIWVELYDRVVPEAMDFADVVITCSQQGQYHKHIGYNIGLLQARGQIITVCDSDAVFPADFVRSILDSFHYSGENTTENREPIPLILMHYEWRTKQLYPDDLTEIDQLSRYEWLNLWPNAGACMSVRTIDAIRFGGFDEHASYRGYMCGPYDLGWRLVNAGIPEIWHDPGVALWHFAHPDPVGSFNQRLTFDLWREISHPHIDGHALTAVELFSSGRMLPRRENPEVYERRMQRRQIGTEFETRYSRLTGPQGFSRLEKIKLYLSLINAFLQAGIIRPNQSFFDPFQNAIIYIRKRLLINGREPGHKLVKSLLSIDHPELILEDYRGFNLVFYKDRFYILALALGPVDIINLNDETLQKYRQRSLGAVVNAFKEVKPLIDRFAAKLAETGYQSPDIELLVHLVERCRGFNIVRYGAVFYGLSLTLGHVDITRLDEQAIALYQSRQQLVRAGTLDEARASICQLSPEPVDAPPVSQVARYKARLRGLAQKIKSG